MQTASSYVPLLSSFHLSFHLLFQDSPWRVPSISVRMIRSSSDDEVITAIHNLHVLMLKKKEVKNSDATGDGTGYGLTVKKNYESYAQKLKELAKENPGNHGEYVKHVCEHPV